MFTAKNDRINITAGLIEKRNAVLALRRDVSEMGMVD
jgi:hypothetical protein